MEKDTSEIAKLTERIAKDPKSKLFVPLAEEYKKAGDIEMAIQVLTDGLASSPGYVTARSFLGRLLLDKGDLAGAQKEFEEVIKAIPDNLLAQRKLGDIYVIQGRGGDAQQRYKAALALNPADKELPSLLADLEAGKDISARFPKPKVTAPPAPAAAVQAQQKTPAAGAAKPAGVPPVPPVAAQKTAPAASTPPRAETAPAAPVAPKPAPKAEVAPAATVAPPRPVAPEPAAVPVRDEVEVIEDIVEIEALEKPAPPPKSKTPAIEVPAEPKRDEPAPPAAAAFEAPAFDLNEFGAEASTAAVDATDASWGPEAFSMPPAVTAEAVPPVADEGGDDLNTNTLAELYISQGFYDKAIEVYQGMLGDRPDNKALKQKLEKLRVLAGAADKGADISATAVPGPGEYVPAGATATVELQAPAKVVLPAQESAPVEVPAQKVVREAAPESAVARGPQAATTRRKETIDRLESWLSNIMKEKK